MTGSKTKKPNSALLFLRRLLLVLLTTVLLLAGFVYGVMYLLCRGPSETAKELFVLSTGETSAIGFLPRLFLSEEEIRSIAADRSDPFTERTDASLVTVASDPEAAVETDAWGYADEDGDGLILVPVAGESFVGNMLIVLDPSRVILGCVPESFYHKGFMLEELVERFGAVAGINGGGFEDESGMGDGSVPDTTTISFGTMYMGFQGPGFGFVGFDDAGILHVGLQSNEELIEKNIQHGTGYGPVLVVNGEAADAASLRSGLNPRTAIGQRSDGAVLMLVVNGRQSSSLGCTYADEAALMLKFGAINACNLDGGTSSLLWYDGDYLGNSATIVGLRPIPTGFLVLPKEVDGHG